MKLINILSAMLVICDGEGTAGDTPYHYITQVAEPTSQTLTPKALFSPHDVRRDASSRRALYQLANQSNTGGYGYGGKPPYHSTGVSAGGYNLEYSNIGGIPGGVVQDVWYPLYTDVGYTGLVDYSQTPYVVSYGALPVGYAPTVPLNSDTGYSFSYAADDHNRQEVSDGRGNYYSSFYFVPPSHNTPSQSGGLPPSYHTPSQSGGLPPSYRTPSQSGGLPPSYHNPSQSRGSSPSSGSDFFSTSRPPVVNIPKVTPTLGYRDPSTMKPIFVPAQSSRSFDTPTARPLVSSRPDYSDTDFSNGFNFESKKLFSSENPQQHFTGGSHALSTNIQYDSVAGASSPKPDLSSSGRRRVTIEPRISSSASSPQVSTERSYQALSRSLPLAIASRRSSTTVQSTSNISTENPYSPKANRVRSSPRSSPRRSSPEAADPYTDFLKITTVPPTSSKKPSVIQKIPRKLKPKNTSADSVQPRPSFIDDLTSLGFSTDSLTQMNNTIIQYKAKKDSPPVTNNYLKDSNRTSDPTNKDAYISGNKTYLGGLGLGTNIHY